MEELAPGGIWSLLDKGGTLAVVSIVLWALLKGKLVPEYVYKAKERECEEWKKLAQTDRALAHRGTDLASNTAQVAERAAEIAAEIIQRRIAGGQRHGGDRDGGDYGTD